MALKSIEKDATAVAKIALASVHLAEGLLEFLFLVQVFLAPLGLIAGVGLFLVVIRRLYFIMVPYLLINAPLEVGIINFFGAAVNVFVDAMIIAYDVLTQGLALVINAPPFFANFQPKILPPVAWSDITVEEYTSVLKLTARECHDIDSIFKVWSITGLPVTSNASCSYFRAVTPIFGNGVHESLDFVTHDAEPLPGNNCNSDDMSLYSAELCTFLASGYMLLEILLPLFLLGLLLMAAGKSVYQLFEYSVLLVVHLCEQLGEVLSRAIEWLRPKAQRLRQDKQP